MNPLDWIMGLVYWMIDWIEGGVDLICLCMEG